MNTYEVNLTFPAALRLPVIGFTVEADCGSQAKAKALQVALQERLPAAKKVEVIKR